MAADFNAVVIEGIFYLDANPFPDASGKARDGENLRLLVGKNRVIVDAQDVYAALTPMVGQRVHLAVHHLPPNPPDPNRWGGGCCLWEPAGRCPFGHHEDTTRLYSYAGEGILVYDLDLDTCSGGWWLELFDGSRDMLPLAHVLPGHQARIAVATAVSVDRMREMVAAGGLDTLTARAADLSAALKRLRRGDG